jgi:hypothetical protein
VSYTVDAGQGCCCMLAGSWLLAVGESFSSAFLNLLAGAFFGYDAVILISVWFSYSLEKPLFCLFVMLALLLMGMDFFSRFSLYIIVDSFYNKYNVYIFYCVKIFNQIIIINHYYLIESCSHITFITFHTRKSELLLFKRSNFTHACTSVSNSRVCVFS